MAADRSAQPVDVLAVMDDRANAIESKWPKAYADGLREARAAVAELIEAAEGFRAVTAGDDAGNSGWEACKRLDAALARMGTQP